MTPAHEHNYILRHESAVEALKDHPHDRDLQHRAVLSLARAGALTFAIAEYQRFGLRDVKDHEDIMALDGRLSKDLYIQSSGSEALKHAKDAAQKYEAAFGATQGYYSGINSATMALMAELPEQAVAGRVSAVRALLPPPENLTPEDHYFIEATRAECFFLTGNRVDAVKSLQSAVNFDPLNFSAHASTLKQFKMIAKKRSEPANWLDAFNPPRPAHFAGRITIDLSDDQLEAMRVTLSDTIQKNDIGFGYGALAAGYDILIAEALLEEGARLHVVLPCPIARFVEHSVRPYGDDWVERFESCLTQAASLKILHTNVPWPSQNINRLSGQMAMGQAILRGQSLSVDPEQLLILGEKSESSYTSKHALDWAKTDHLQICLPGGGAQQAQALDTEDHFQSVLRRSDIETTQRFDTPRAAITAATAIQARSPETRIAIHIDIPDVETDRTAQHILEHGAPQSVLLSEVFASLLALSDGDKFDITYAGRVKGDADEPLRCYAVTSR